MDIVGPITTDNPTFDQAIEVLRRYHLCHHWGDGSIRIYLNQRPVGLTGKAKWVEYVDALLTVDRSPWTTAIDERGRVGYLALPAHLEAERR